MIYKVWNMFGSLLVVSVVSHVACDFESQAMPDLYGK